MGSHTLILYETGLNDTIPDLRSVSAVNFPIWGEYRFADCAISNFLPFGDIQRILFLEGVHRGAYHFVINRWKKHLPEIVTTSHGIQGFLDIIEALSTDTLILSSLSFIAFFQRDAVLALAADRGSSILKLSIDGTPLDLYIADRKRMINVIRSRQIRYSKQEVFGRALFAEVLGSCFEEMADVSGRFVFQNNLYTMYRENLSLTEADDYADMRTLDRKLGSTEAENPASSIGEKAYVKNSYIASGVDIQGMVENSVIFPGVSVKAKTKIYNSVIMNDNQIGSNVEVSSALIFPYTKEIMKGGSNVEDNVVIGAHSSLAKNRDFPEQIHDGLTVLGTNAVVPRGSVIEQGCYIGANMPSHELKKNRILKKGRSLYHRERPGKEDDV